MWQEYKYSQQIVLGLIAVNEVKDEQVTFIETEETYEAAIDEANRIIKGKIKAEKVRDSQLERTVHLVTRRRDLHEQIKEILDHIKEELEKVEVTQSRGSLKVQCESLMTTQFRMRQAKEMTKELLSHHHDNGAALTTTGSVWSLTGGSWS